MASPLRVVLTPVPSYYTRLHTKRPYSDPPEIAWLPLVPQLLLSTYRSMVARIPRPNGAVAVCVEQ